MTRRPFLPEVPRKRRPPMGWLRHFVGFADHPKWKRIAHDARVPVSIVVHVVVKLLEVANHGHPRGSVTNFSVATFAISSGIESEEVNRVWAALEKIGFIDREYLTKWDEWQPDKEDPTHRERQARYREKKQAERLASTQVKLAAEASPHGPGDGVTSVTRTPVTASREYPVDLPAKKQERLAPGDGVTSVTRTPRPDQNIEQTTEPGDEVDQAKVWLYGRGKEGGEGVYLVMEGTNRTSENYARWKIKEWLEQLDDDVVSLALIIASSRDKCKGDGDAYVQLINQQVATARQLASASPRLPLGPMLAKGSS
jgi:hypothetical protein